MLNALTHNPMMDILLLLHASVVCKYWYCMQISSFQECKKNTETLMQTSTNMNAYPTLRTRTCIRMQAHPVTMIRGHVIYLNPPSALLITVHCLLPKHPPYYGQAASVAAVPAQTPAPALLPSLSDASTSHAPDAGGPPGLSSSPSFPNSSEKPGHY